VWKRALRGPTVLWLVAAFVAAAVFANVYPFDPDSSTEALTALHLPIALWLAVGVAYAAVRWKQVDGRMDFIRFSGELFIYYVLIALGGAVLTAFTVAMFEALDVDPETFIQSWLLPCGAAGAVVVASWLVEAKQSVIENMAPVLTRLFTPMFAAVLIAFLGAVIWTGGGVDVERSCSSPSICSSSSSSVSSSIPSPLAIPARRVVSSTCCRSCSWSALSSPTRWPSGQSRHASRSSGRRRTASQRSGRTRSCS
jgi:hypothetical protein